MQETWAQFLGQEDPLEKKMATHSSILAWRIPWTEEPGGLQSMGSQESDMTYLLNHRQNYLLFQASKNVKITESMMKKTNKRDFPAGLVV